MSIGAIRSLAQECYNLAKATDRPTRTVAQDLVRDADASTVAALAVEYLVGLVAAEQRAEALEVERHAARPPAMPRKGSKARATWEAETPEGRAWAAAEDAAWFRMIERTKGVLTHALHRYAEDLQIEWTADLLASGFTLRDGATVTWGDATVEQHEERRAIFLGNAHVNLEGAARHEVAIRELREAGAESLRALTHQAA